MPVVKTLDKNSIDASLHEVFDHAEKHFGKVPNLVKALANNPTLCTSITNFMIQSLDKGRISWAFKRTHNPEDFTRNEKLLQLRSS